MRSPRIRVTRQFTFDMAHALFGHKGLCKNIHGHTYTLSITLLGDVIKDPGNTNDGMVIDFSVLRDLVKEKVISVYDHALVLNGNSPHRELHPLTQSFEKVLYMDKQPTCENLVVLIAGNLNRYLPHGMILHHVSLQETPTSRAEWFYEDNV